MTGEAMTGERRTRRADRILIVGGGIAGLSLALAIRRWDLRPDIVERADGWPTSGAGLYLIGAATRALGQLGLAEQLRDEGAVTRVQTFCDHRGNRLAEVDVDRYWRECGPCLGISRTALHQVLADRIAGLPIRFGTSVLAIHQEESGVSVEFTDGSSESYDLVVGADGVRSTVRRLVVGDAEPRFRGQIGWRFISRQTATTPPDGWTVYLGAGSAFLLVPIGRDAVYCYADRVASTREVEPPGTVRRLRERFRRFALPVQDMLAQLGLADQPHQSPIEESAHEAWGRGRVVLIGDAAHAMSPNMACGAAMALEDSLVLAEIVGQPGNATEVVHELTNRRSARVRWVWRQTNQRDRLRRLPSVVRNFVLRQAAERTYQANYRPLLAPP
jgi:2-polyprenyl-6-methoxyphenol hydroxylase-like FAD-dependent oxidoreductase